MILKVEQQQEAGRRTRGGSWRYFDKVEDVTVHPRWLYIVKDIPPDVPTDGGPTGLFIVDAKDDDAEHTHCSLEGWDHMRLGPEAHGLMSVGGHVHVKVIDITRQTPANIKRIVTSGEAYLLSDEGKTIERL